MNTALQSLALIGNLNTWELLVILAIGLLIFGRRLPEVGRSLGKGIIEFKKGLKGVEDDVDDASSGRTDGRVKYPRTYHLPWSPGRTSDDRVLPSLDGFIGEDVVVTAKMDGENTTLRRECLHARSLDWEPHPSRTMIKALHARVAADIPAGWRLCGENLQAVHSIRYTQLPDVFLLFSVWDERNRCLSWAETLDWALLLDLATDGVHSLAAVTVDLASLMAQTGGDADGDLLSNIEIWITITPESKRILL
jgi:TatA/E family protein of Tat protein translocase